MLHVLFVCTGNTCRSPMAKGIYEELSRKHGIVSIFSSAALGFSNGQPASEKAVEVCKEIGIDISEHRSRTIKEYDLGYADLFVVMTENHAETLLGIGIPKEKIHILGGGIPDPYGSDLSTYRQCRDKIVDGIEELCKLISQNKRFLQAEKSRRKNQEARWGHD